MSTPDISKLKIQRDANAQIGSAHSRRWRWIRIGLLVVLLATAAWAIGRFVQATPGVDTATVTLNYPAQNFTLLNATGYAVAQRKAALSSKASGRLEWLGVLEGSHVKKNEVIARLENRDVSAALDQAVANIKITEANLQQGLAELRDAEHAYRRAQQLVMQQFISAAANDDALARLNKGQAAVGALRAAIVAAQASAQVARVALDQTLIRAPFDGVVLTKNANVGDNITPFSSAADSKGAVVTIADMGTLEVEADVSESNLAKIKVDQPCEIQLEALPDLRLAGLVSRIVPTVDRAKATVLVKVRFVESDPRLLPDMSAKVAFLSKALTVNEKQAVTAVQPGAVVERNGKKVVFVVKGSQVWQTDVQLGKSLGELVAVQGVQAGDKVVLMPPGKLKNGSQVSFNNPAKGG